MERHTETRGKSTVSMEIDDTREPRKIELEFKKPEDQEISITMVAPQFTQTIVSVIIKDGQPATFRAVVTGRPTPDILWFRSGAEIVPEECPEFTITFDTGGVCTLTLEEAFPEDSGPFECRAINPAGQATCMAKLVVVGGFSTPFPCCFV